MSPSQSVSITRSDDHHPTAIRWLVLDDCQGNQWRHNRDASPTCPVASLDRGPRTVRPTIARAELRPNRAIPQRRAQQPGNTSALRSSRPRRGHVSRIGWQAAGHNVALGCPSKARPRSVPALGNSRPAYNHRLLTLRPSERRGERAQPTQFSTRFAGQGLTTSSPRNAGRV
jgi:hypothetical protein